MFPYFDTIFTLAPLSVLAMSSSSAWPDCAVCLQPPIHPVQLECDHIFCFLCVKGASTTSRRCPMCRSDISANYLDNPKLIRPLEEVSCTVN